MIFECKHIFKAIGIKTSSVIGPSIKTVEQCVLCGLLNEKLPDYDDWVNESITPISSDEYEEGHKVFPNWSPDFNAVPKHTPIIIQQEVIWDTSMDEPKKYVGKPLCWRVK